MRFFLFLITANLAIAGEFASSIGDTYPYLVSAIATDSTGNTYAVGNRALDNADVVLNPSALAGGTDVFVTKLDPNGKVLFTDTFAGKGVDTGIAIAIDPAGNIYISGTTTSNDFPLSNALQTQSCDCGTGFIMKLSNDGATILYSTYFGGTLGTTLINSLATDANGNLYLTGQTYAADFPHTSGMPFGQIQSNPSLIISGAIIASISAAGDKLLYSGAISGTLGGVCGSNHGVQFCETVTAGVGIAVDAAGNAYIGGNSGATDLPTTAGVLAPSGSGGFIAKINPNGGGIGYLTYLPASISTMTADAIGDTYFAGYGFVGKLKPDASAILWKTTVGGAVQGTLVQSLAVDAAQNVWATGISYPSLIPNTNGWTTGTDFIAGLNTAGSLTYSALYASGTVAQSVAVDPAGLVHVAGMNGFVSAIPATSKPAGEVFYLENAAGGNATARLSPAEVISIYGPGIGPAAAATGTLVNGSYPKTLAGVQVTIDGIAIPLLYVSANQINAVVPMALMPGAGAILRVTNGTASIDFPVWIVYFAPQAFSGVLNQDGTLNSQANPAKGGSIVTFYATGWQSDFSPLADGQVASMAQNLCQGGCPLTSGPADAAILYAGAAPGIVAGVTQFNVFLGTLPALTSVSLLNLSVSNLVFLSPAISQTFVTPALWVDP